MAPEANSLAWCGATLLLGSRVVHRILAWHVSGQPTCHGVVGGEEVVVVDKKRGHVFGKMRGRIVGARRGERQRHKAHTHHPYTPFLCGMMKVCGGGTQK